MPEQYVISPSQGHRLMAVAVMIRDGDLELRGDEQEDADSAREAIIDVAQELALQVEA